MGKFLAFFLVFVPLWAQDQSGVTLAEQIGSVSVNLMDRAIGCPEQQVAVVGMSQKEAQKYCLKVIGKITDVVSDMSDDVSGAADANKPLVVVSRYGGYGYSRSYYSSRPAPVYYSAPKRRSAPERQATPECPATPQRPSSRRGK